MAEEYGKWISVKDAMPMAIQEYWCWLMPKPPFYSTVPGYDDTLITPNFPPYARTVRTYQHDDGVIAFNCGGTEHVTHWMPLPSPPKV